MRPNRRNDITWFIITNNVNQIIDFVINSHSNSDSEGKEKLYKGIKYRKWSVAITLLWNVLSNIKLVLE